MINEEKVRELFNIALCDSKSDDSRVQKQSASYYGWDYIWKEGLKKLLHRYIRICRACCDVGCCQCSRAFGQNQ